MEGENNVQKRFFQELKAKLPSNLSLANVVADELNISIDSAYRRIRNESDLSLQEFDALSSKYSISTEAVFSKTHGSVHFSYRCIDSESFDFENYFNSLIDEITSLERYGLKEMIYLALDLPLFYYFLFPKLAAFKVFFWERNVFNFPGNHERRFNFDLIPKDNLDKSHHMLKVYQKVPTIEIWSEETLNSTLRQINFYNEIGLFENRLDIIAILEDLKKVVDHIQKQAELGYKFNSNSDHPINGNHDNFKIYHNEVTLSDNVVLIKLENFNMVHIGHNVLNILSTSNQNFFNDNLFFVNRVMKNSTLMSVSAEKERKRFFNLLHHKIDAMMANI
jgi:hypothetical protein